MDDAQKLAWPADRVERRPLSGLIPYARNARTHSAAQVAQVAASMQEWGWTNPVLVDEAGGIIAGHCRVLAAGELGFTEAPVMVAEGWSEEQKRAYVLADNQLALNAGWDGDMLASELEGLGAAGFDLDLLGFDDIDALLARGTAGRTDPDEVPPTPAVPVSGLGDVWMLGRHRLVCGDCTEADAVKMALSGVKPHLMVTDPPYGVDYDPMWRNVVKRRDGSLVGAKATGVVTNDDRADWREAWALFPGEVAYVWHGALHSSTVAASLISSGFEIRSQIIWRKDQFVIGRGDYHWQHEPCWYVVRKGKTGHYVGGRAQSSVWNIAAASGYRQVKEGADAHSIHSAQKPVEAMRRPIVNNSRSGEAVYDPFSGSGTTIIAAEMTGRACHAIELHPAYVDVAIIRWQAFTGNEATLEATGRTFAEVAAERVPEEAPA